MFTNIGQIINGYELIRKIKEIGISRIYKVKDVEANQVRLIKAIDQALFNYWSRELMLIDVPNIKEKLNVEAVILKQLNNENIVRIYDYFEFNDCYCFVTEYIEGTTLEDIIEGKTDNYQNLSVNKVLQIFHQVLSAIKYAHIKKIRNIQVNGVNYGDVNGVVHGNITPSDIIITSDNLVKVADFRIGKMLYDITKPSVIPGYSVDYMSPEQKAGEPANFNSDIYSLGLILSAVLKNVNNVPKYIERAIQKATHKDPQQRFNTIQKFEEALIGEEHIDIFNISKNEEFYNLEGKVINDYFFESRIKGGGMSIFYKVKHQKLNCYRGIKELNYELVAHIPNAEETLKKEVEMLSQLQNENIIQMYDCFAYNSRIFFVMEYVDNCTSLNEIISPILTENEYQSLLSKYSEDKNLLEKIVNKRNDKYSFSLYDASLLKRTRRLGDNTFKQLLNYTPKLTIDKAMHIFKQVLNAIKYSHNMNIIHRDIKPSNILVTKQDNVKVIDFDIARLLRDSEGTMVEFSNMSAMISSYECMAPEQIDGEEIGYYTDVYSLGLVLFHILTGVPAFNLDRTSTIFAIADDQRYKPLPNPLNFNKKIPLQIVKAIQKATEKNPKNRFQTVDEFEKALF